MRIDVFSIFPEYLEPLQLSLIGKAQDAGLLDVQVHNVREFASDARRTVDDTPYGGGAGMVMLPQVWGDALASVVPAAETPVAPELKAAKPVLLVPSPAGRLFSQSLAQELAAAKHLVVACGRYEGIDERVLVDAERDFQVIPVSLGDYVLNGGEVAALVMIEAITRLVPGVIGNPESLVEESHENGLLEYPVYTKPAVWRDLSVPEVLLSGDHAKVSAWRHQQQLARTAVRRPDLLPPHDAGGIQVRPASLGDQGQIDTLMAGDEVSLVADESVLVALRGTRIVGVAQLETAAAVVVTWLCVVPDERKKGIAELLLTSAAKRATAAALPCQVQFPMTRKELSKWAKRRKLRRCGAPDEQGNVRFEWRK